MLTKKIYGAVYDGLAKGFNEGEFEICVWEDGDVCPISSGCSSDAGGHAIMENVSSSDFGDWSQDEMTRREFVNYCIEVFGDIDARESLGACIG